MQSLLQDRMQGEIVNPYVQFIWKTCREKEKWIRGESCESQMCSCHKWNGTCLHELTFYFGTSSKWRWTKWQKECDTICICFYVSCQWLIMKISNPYLVFWTWKTILKSIGVAQLGGRLLNMLATSFSNQWICYSSNKFVALTCDEVVTLDN